MFKQSIRTKIFLAILLPLVLIEGALLGLYLDHVNEDFSSRYKHIAATISSPFSRAIEQKFTRLLSLEDQRGFLEIYAEVKGEIEFSLWLQDYRYLTGVVFIDDTGKQLAATKTSGEFDIIAAKTDPQTIISTHEGGGIAVSVPIRTTQTTFGHLLFRFSDQEVVAQKQAAIPTAGGIFSISLLLGSLLAWILSRAITKPINLLAFDSKCLAAGDIDHDICALNSTDEIGTLARNFRRMRDAIRDKLQNQLESERNFRRMFEGAEISIWNENMSELYLALENLRQTGITDLRNYLAVNPQEVWELASLVKVIQVNDATLNLFGAQDKEDLLQQIHKTFGPNANSVFISELCAIWNQEKTFRSEADFLTLDGKPLNIIISFQIPETAEDFLSVPVTIIDISERILNEKRLQQSEERFSLFMQNLPGIAYIKDHQNKYIYANEQFCAILKRDLQQVLGKNNQELFSANTAAQLDNNDDKLRNQQQPIAVEESATFDGTTQHYLTVKFPFPIPGREDSGIAGVALNISSRKQAENELNQLRNYLTNIVDSMPSALIGVDIDGQVTQWNSEAEKLTDISKLQALRQPLADLLPQYSSKMALINNAMTSQQKQVTRHRRQTAAGVRYEDVTIYPLIGSSSEGAVIRIDDVTERVRIDAMMVQSEKMLSVGGLAAGMAHEINNPLAGMMQTATVLANRLTKELPANSSAAEAAGISMASLRAYMDAREVPQMLQRIQDSGVRVADIVTNMLSFARKDTDVTSGCHLDQLLERSLELAGSDYDLKKKYDFRKIEIVRAYAANCAPVACEAGMMQQVFLNILRNGAEAMQDNPDPEKNPPRFTLRLKQNQATATASVEIEDNGPGIDPETCKRIFEPFFTTKAVGSGTGLGLSVSYFIVTENHKGKLSVESIPGQGTKFIISLPSTKKG